MGKLIAPTRTPLSIHTKYYFFMKSIFKFSLLFVFLFTLNCSNNFNNTKIEQLIGNLTEYFAPDKRVAIFDVQVKQCAEKSVIVGKTNLPEAYKALIDSLTAIDVMWADSIKLLPDEKLGGKIWGLVSLSVIPIRKGPAYREEMVSQALMGTPVKILEAHNGWYHIQTPDKYIGWAKGSGFKIMTANELEKWKQDDRFVFSKISGSIFSKPDKNSQHVSDIVLGGIVQSIGENEEYLHVKLPDGRVGFLKSSCCISFNKWALTNPESKNIIAMAKLLVGRPYLWGGMSTKSIDCSGLIRTAYFSQGVILARDASQQAIYGEILDISNYVNLKPADLLFFGRDKNHITHVAMCIGDNRYIHSSGRVKINSLDSLDLDFSLSLKKNLVASRRILNSLNKNGIIQVKNHPWYN